MRERPQGRRKTREKNQKKPRFLTISISLILAYRGHCFVLSNNVAPLPSRDIVTAAKPHPSNPAASPTPTTAFPLHFGPGLPSLRAYSVGTVVVALLVLAHLRLAIDNGAAGKRRQALALLPGSAARPRARGEMRGSALRIELANMQAIVKCSCHVMRTACDWVRGLEMWSIPGPFKSRIPFGGLRLWSRIRSRTIPLLQDF